MQRGGWSFVRLPPLGVFRWTFPISISAKHTSYKISSACLESRGWEFMKAFVIMENDDNMHSGRLWSMPSRVVE